MRTWPGREPVDLEQTLRRVIGFVQARQLRPRDRYVLADDDWRF